MSYTPCDDFLGGVHTTHTFSYLYSRNGLSTSST